jgi:phosphatidylglycerol:prolipoprotein diacylglycerol transferase
MHPVLIQIGDFVIGTYGLMLVIGLLAGLGAIVALARRRGYPADFFYDLMFVSLVSGFVGARLTYIGLNWSRFLEHPIELILSRQGFVFLGGFLFAVAAAVAFTRRRGLPIMEVADLAAPGLVLGHAFGRIGCFLAGCCFGLICTPDGHPTLSRIAVGYPVVYNRDGTISEMFNYAYGSQLDQGLIGLDATRSLPMAPVQLMEAAGDALIFVLLLWAWRRRRFSGQIAAGYLVLYSGLRFGLEFLRGDVERGVWFGGVLSTSQIICIATLAAGVALWWWRRDKGEIAPPVMEHETKAGGDPPGGASTRTGGKRRGRRRESKPTPQA